MPSYGNVHVKYRRRVILVIQAAQSKQKYFELISYRFRSDN